MIENITTAIGFAGAAATAFDTAANGLARLKGLFAKETPQDAQYRAQIVEITTQLLAAQEANLETKKLLLKLKEEEQRRSKFEQQASRYTLTTTDRGGLVYSLNPDDAKGEPPHDLCAACFEQEKRSIMQFVQPNTLECPLCKTRVPKSDGKNYGMVAARSRGGSPFAL
ncbi:hypothetical protein [Paracoccus sanguinis]|uniref:Uncharacterized protein n=1 Tax=Paracoccus sanguinis TaxID=1545044 RepID=A0A1H2SNV2_9RHOB|nr:hypothetical protein [Paracoccus sanguinis]KGJ19337.1 hypothetical protein IX57_00310 [Paracoccus sanguinis]SDW32729.1 hypothetical protein SAMN05444276_101673 [Paracoccus sanguinis]